MVLITVLLRHWPVAWSFRPVVGNRRRRLGTLETLQQLSHAAGIAAGAFGGPNFLHLGLKAAAQSLIHAQAERLIGNGVVNLFQQRHENFLDVGRIPSLQVGPGESLRAGAFQEPRGRTPVRAAGILQRFERIQWAASAL
jgi:hypothetical protein